MRYSTAGSSTRENAQPLVLNYVKGTLALAHNGNLINAPELREELSYTGAIFQTTIDSEVIAYHISNKRCLSRRIALVLAKIVFRHNRWRYKMNDIGFNRSLFHALMVEKANDVKSGIYGLTQREFAFNSNK